MPPEWTKQTDTQKAVSDLMTQLQPRPSTPDVVIHGLPETKVWEVQIIGDQGSLSLMMNKLKNQLKEGP
jgi:hypothetical protein